MTRNDLVETLEEIVLNTKTITETMKSLKIESRNEFKSLFDKIVDLVNECGGVEKVRLALKHGRLHDAPVRTAWGDITPGEWCQNQESLKALLDSDNKWVVGN